MKANAFLAVALAAPIILAKSNEGFSCGSHAQDRHIRDTETLRAAEIVSRGAGIFGRADKALEVPVYMHAAVCETKYCKTLLTTPVMQEQFIVLKKAFAPYDINLSLKNISRIVNTKIASFNASDDALTNADNDYRMKTRRGGYDALNMYFYTNMTGALGVCSFPQSDISQADLYGDGCHVLGGTVPGGSVSNYNQGLTAAHEAGHWFNLYHTFNYGSCEGRGDFIADTPAQFNSTQGCPKQRDSCPGLAGLDPIHNFMDYSYDSCYEGFTAGQKSRMHLSYKALRQGRKGPGSAWSS